MRARVAPGPGLGPEVAVDDDRPGRHVEPEIVEDHQLAGRVDAGLGPDLSPGRTIDGHHVGGHGRGHQRGPARGGGVGAGEEVDRADQAGGQARGGAGEQAHLPSGQARRGDQAPGARQVAQAHGRAAVGAHQQPAGHATRSTMARVSSMPRRGSAESLQ